MAAAALIVGGCIEKTEENNSVTIRGSVVTSGEPVNAAAILLTPGGGVKITGSDGMYEFADLQPGRYELKVFKEGMQSYNQSVDVSDGKDKEVTLMLTKGAGKLSINKAYIDMGLNEGNNTAGFSVVNSGSVSLSWSITNAARWISKVDPASGTMPANSSAAVVITIDRSKLSTNTTENYATLVARSTTAGDGSIAELLVTVFGNGLISGGDYVTIDGLTVQTRDLGGQMSWDNAVSTCNSSTVGGFNDWYLPSIGELAAIYSKKEAIGGFVTSSNGSGYWSSSYYDNYRSYYIAFYNGTQYYDYDHVTHRCRCVRTSSPVPVVTTLAATNVSLTTATLNGRIDKAGEPAFTERGFVYSASFQNPTIEDDNATTKRVVSGTSTEFSANVSGLTTEQTYYVRAYATNSNGTVYGTSLSFKPTAVVDYLVLQSEGIMVQKNDISSGADWSTANSLCNNSSVGGFSTWRLPTFGELRTLYNQRTTIGGFSTTQSGSRYWSATADSYYGSSYHEYIDFNNGSSDSYSGPKANSNTYRARCVRNLP